VRIRQTVTMVILVVLLVSVVPCVAASPRILLARVQVGEPLSGGWMKPITGRVPWRIWAQMASHTREPWVLFNGTHPHLGYEDNQSKLKVSGIIRKL
jgi:hypothetical protein